MQRHTHQTIDPELCGTPVAMTDGIAEVEMTAIARMAVDDRGLVHGGFVFGLADHAAMLAIDAPTVVLGAAELRFVAPVRVGDCVRARAELRGIEGKKHLVDVEAKVGERSVLRGSLTCFVPERHVLADAEIHDARR